jgi:hypothetical protein
VEFGSAKNSVASFLSHTNVPFGVFTAYAFGLGATALRFDFGPAAKTDEAVKMKANERRLATNFFITTLPFLKMPPGIQLRGY